VVDEGCFSGAKESGEDCAACALVGFGGCVGGGCVAFLFGAFSKLHFVVVVVIVVGWVFIY